MTKNKHDTVQNWGRFLVEAVRTYAQQNNIQFELFSGDWIMRLETSDPLSTSTTKYLFGNDFGLNNTATRAICNDKSACYQVLTREDIPALEHRILLRPGSLGAPQHGTFTLAQQAFTDFDTQAVCKPNSGSSGSDIYFVTSQTQLEKSLIDLFAHHRAITISPFVPITAEYRVCVLNGNVELVYEKIRKDGETQHNLSHGALAQPVTNTSLHTTLSTLAIQATDALNATFVHVDIIDVDGKLMILEINSGIMFEHYAMQSEENKQRATAIYHKALDILFEESKNLHSK